MLNTTKANCIVLNTKDGTKMRQLNENLYLIPNQKTDIYSILGR